MLGSAFLHPRMSPCGPERSLVVLTLILAFSVAASAADLRIVGSDLPGLEFTRSLYAFAGREGLALAVALDGSRPGLAALKSSRADLALLTLPPGERSDLAGFESLPLAAHRVVVIVPTVMPLESITLAQLAAIYGANAPLNYSRWGDLGLADEWAGSPIVAHAPAAGFGLTAAYFRRAGLRDQPFRSQVGRYASAADLVQRLAGDSRALAIASALPPGATEFKVVPVAAQAGDPAFSPTAANLQSGDYPLGLPLVIVFRRESAERLWPVLRFLLSDEAAALLERAELVPAPSAQRRRQLLARETK